MYVHGLPAAPPIGNVSPKHFSTDASVKLDYDIVYVRAPRKGDAVGTNWPEIANPVFMDAGADLMARIVRTASTDNRSHRRSSWHRLPVSVFDGSPQVAGIRRSRPQRIERHTPGKPNTPVSQPSRASPAKLSTERSD